MSAGAGGLEKAAPRELPRGLVALCGIAVAIGVVAFLYGLATDPATAWRAFHVNTFYFGCVAQAGVVLAAALVIIGAKWAGPVRRVAESLGAWVPVTFVLALVGFLGRGYVYPWIANPVPAKSAWLNVPRMVAMDLGVLALLTLVTLLFLYHSVRPTLHGVTGQGAAKGLFERWTAGWRGQAEEEARSADKLRRLAPILALLYAYGWSVLAIDQIMSLAPTWYSILFPGFVAWGGFLCAIALTSLLSILHRNAPRFEGQFNAARLHDLGKMLFAFSIFWMYLFWAQYLVIWYGNLPEETQFFEARLGPQFLMEPGHEGWYWNFSFDRMNAAPYGWMSMLVWALIWIIPFWVLLGARSKKSPLVNGTVSALMVLGFWLERNLLVWPSFDKLHGLAWLGPIQVGIALGFVGAFTLVWLLYTRVFPTLAAPQQR